MASQLEETCLNGNLEKMIFKIFHTHKAFYQYDSKDDFLNHRAEKILSESFYNWNISSTMNLKGAFLMNY